MSKLELNNYKCDGFDERSIGIYYIECTANGNKYVGSARSEQSRSSKGGFLQRFTVHFKDLENNRHCNYKLQDDYNMYGKDKFEFVLLENVDIDLIYDQELYWINMINPYYNIVRNPVEGHIKKHTLESRRKMAISSGAREFEVYDKDGNHVGNWINQTKCAEDLGLLQCKVNSCLKGRVSHTKNYKFKFVGEDFKYVKKESNPNSIRKGFKVSEETKRKLSNSLKGKKKSKEHIEKMVKTKRKMYEEGTLLPTRYYQSKEERIESSKRIGKHIYQLIKDEKVVEEFDSLMLLAERLNCNKTTACNKANSKYRVKGYHIRKIKKGDING